MKPEHYQMLAEAKLTVEQIGVVMRIMAEAEEAMKAAEDARKAVARERVQRWRDKQKDGVTLPKRNGNATVRLTRVEDSSSKKDISNNKKDNISLEFESEFWPVYPRKVGKPAALKAYIAARKRSSFETIMTGARRYAQERAGEEAQFTKHPQRWLSGDHWNDDPAPPRTATGPPRKRNYVDVALDQFAGKSNGSESIFGSHGDAQRIPPRVIESRPDDANLRGGIGGRIRPSDC